MSSAKKVYPARWALSSIKLPKLGSFFPILIECLNSLTLFDIYKIPVACIVSISWQVSPRILMRQWIFRFSEFLHCEISVFLLTGIQPIIPVLDITNRRKRNCSIAISEASFKSRLNADIAGCFKGICVDLIADQNEG